MAMEETLVLEEAVEVALSLTQREDTLILLTADHSHSVTINGYPERGNPILGTAGEFSWDQMEGPDGPQPYTTISYANGPGFDFHFNRSLGFWNNIVDVDTEVVDAKQLISKNVFQ